MNIPMKDSHFSMSNEFSMGTLMAGIKLNLATRDSIFRKTCQYSIRMIALINTDT